MIWRLQATAISELLGRAFLGFGVLDLGVREEHGEAPRVLFDTVKNTVNAAGFDGIEPDAGLQRCNQNP